MGNDFLAQFQAGWQMGQGRNENARRNQELQMEHERQRFIRQQQMEDLKLKKQELDIQHKRIKQEDTIREYQMRQDAQNQMAAAPPATAAMAGVQPQGPEFAGPPPDQINIPQPTTAVPSTQEGQPDIQLPNLYPVQLQAIAEHARQAAMAQKGAELTQQEAIKAKFRAPEKGPKDIFAEAKARAAGTAAGTPATAGGAAGDLTASVDSVLAGNMSPQDFGRGKERAYILNEAARREPGFSTATYHNRRRMREDFQSSQAGSAGGQLSSLNQLSDHLTVLDKAAKALQSGNAQAINGFVNATKEQFGDPNITNYQTAALAVSEEVARLLKGGVAGETEGAAWLKKYSPNLTPEQQAGAVSTTERLVRGRLNALHTKWKAGMGKARADEFYDYLEPAARQMFENVPDTTAAPAASKYKIIEVK